MKVWMLNVLVCPQCLGRLKLRIFETDLKGEIIRGRIFCQACKLNFVIENGVPVFGISAEKKTERYQELDSELKWEFSVDMQSHIKWAKKSAITGERIIQKIKKVLKITSGGGLTVLDVGAGCGALHSWQFSKHGFQVVAAELCPEFLFSIDYFKDENLFFERVVTDCSILPFRESSFDIVFCKQLIHHIEDPLELLSEIWRVTRENGLIVIEEPAISMLRNKGNALRRDKAAKLGITHHYYTQNEYLELFEKVASIIEFNAIPAKFEILEKVLPKKIKKLLTNFIGGSVELIGIKRKDFTIKERTRKVIPMFTEKIILDNIKIEYYRKKVIPSKLEIFLRAHENYLRNLMRYVR